MSTHENFAKRSRTISSSSASSLEKQLPAASLLREADLSQLAAWNATQQYYARERGIPQMVAAQASKFPQQVAVVAEGRQLSYAELNARANQLAHYLQKLGVGPNVRVALCVERSVQLVVGLLGILKAGGAYVPLDPTYPADRLAFMIADAQAPVLLTQQHLLTSLPEQLAHIVCLDGDAQVLSQQSDTDPLAAGEFADLVYVIYTSGSTGRPKGVQITHDSLLNLVYWHQRTFEVTAADRATQLTSPAFDATGWELWPYLTAGASVYIVDEDVRHEPAALLDWLVSQGITISFLPTMLAESVIVLDWPATTRLRYLLTGADTLHRYPPPGLPCALVNNYGPTEATVLVTSGRVPVAEHATIPPSIGRPIANTQIYMLDEQLRQVPIGEPGELCVGGTCLSSGYLNRPELTAEKFIAYSPADGPATRLYRTGDQARYLPNGEIAFMGRIDRQIKIRGYRIEPDEIVSALQEHPAVRACYIMAREDSPDNKRLVAYCVLTDGAQVTLEDLRAPLVTRLPDYMLPSAFVRLDALPVTPNGKVDQAALPEPDASNTLHEEQVAAPNTQVEARLVEIISALLGLEQVGIDENFFLLGGHSLLGTQVIARVADSFGVELPLFSLFSAPTVRQLSSEIERRILASIELLSEEEARMLLT